MMAKERVCPACGIEKANKYFLNSKSEICLLCESKGLKPVVVEDPEPEPEPLTPVDYTQFPAVEVDYNAPSSQELAARILARRNLIQFVRRFRPKYTAGWVHEDIARRLVRFMEAVERGEEPRLLMMMPPRAGKSELGSRNFVPFVLGHHPDWEIIAASHTNSLTLSFSRYIRDLLRDLSYHALFPNTRLDPSSQSVENWNLTGGGGYLAAGVGTGITGRGAHILLLDDLVKDIEAADSQLQRDSVWEWYTSTAYTRLAPGGGVLGIMCMTGDTPVLMATGKERRLDALVVGDEIATYERGYLTTARVTGHKSNGMDAVLRITTASGKSVRANGRHPFLVCINGELKWIRARSLSTAHRIVTLKDSGENGTESSVLQKDAACLPNAAVCATHTMVRSVGRTGTEPQATVESQDATRDLNIVMESQQLITPECSQSKKENAQYAEKHRTKESLATGSTTLRLITATTPENLGGCCATTVMPESDILELSPWHWPLPNTSDFTLDSVVSINDAGEDEVFDVQVERTENFIAGGMVSHNTWWNEDDWAGRIQQVMKADDGGDVFEIIRYPAINEEGDEYLLANDQIVQLPEGSDIPADAKMTRPIGTAIHPERYSTGAMTRIKKNLEASGQKRIWSALYQQNPTPDEGIYFSKSMFKEYQQDLSRMNVQIYQAWDFAITEGTQNDWTVGITVLQDAYDDLYVLDINRFRSGDGENIMNIVVQYAQDWNVNLLGVEDGQIWKALETTFTRICAAKKFYPSYEKLKPLTDKLVRAQPLRGRMQAGKVFFATRAPWYTELKNELLRFPAGKHDDQVDALAWVVRLMLTRSAPQVQKPKEVASWRDKLRQMQAGGRGGAMAA